MITRGIEGLEAQAEDRDDLSTDRVSHDSVMRQLLLAQYLVLVLLLGLQEFSPLELILRLELLHIADNHLLDHGKDLQVLLEIDPAVRISREI